MTSAAPSSAPPHAKMLGRAVVPLYLQFASGVFCEHRDVHVVEFTLVPGAPHDLEGRDGVVSACVARSRENKGCVGVHGLLPCWCGIVSMPSDCAAPSLAPAQLLPTLSGPPAGAIPFLG
jgi:hypothetical protein